MLSWFVNYLGKEVKSAKPHRNKAGDAFRLEPSSVRLYGQAIVTWFNFLADELLLPDRFPASAAVSRAQRTLRTYVPATIARDGAVEPSEGLEKLIYAWDSPSIPDSLPIKGDLSQKDGGVAESGASLCPRRQRRPSERDPAAHRRRCTGSEGQPSGSMAYPGTGKRTRTIWTASNTAFHPPYPTGHARVSKNPKRSWSNRLVCKPC